MIETLDLLQRALDLGGPVVLVLLALSVIALTTMLYKVWQFASSGVGRHRALQQAIDAWDMGDRAVASEALSQSTSYLAPLVAEAMAAIHKDTTRLEAEAEARFALLERGFRLLDSIAQISPLLGLFGTVLGMIEAFQALQEAGAQVDPSLLAGGIWVALLTTAVGLAVAMPTSLVHSWFESRLDAERVLAERAITTVLYPQGHRSNLRSRATEVKAELGRA
ncbi:MAG: MotA/TolQ/ExbB proton channel family protein [Pseudomonadota bacterium]